MLFINALSDGLTHVVGRLHSACSSGIDAHQLAIAVIIENDEIGFVVIEVGEGKLHVLRVVVSQIQHLRLCRAVITTAAGIILLLEELGNDIVVIGVGIGVLGCNLGIESSSCDR